MVNLLMIGCWVVQRLEQRTFHPHSTGSIPVPAIKSTAKKRKKKVTYDVSLVLLTRPLEIFCQRGQSRPYNPRSAHRQGAFFLVLGVKNENREDQYFGNNRI